MKPADHNDNEINPHKYRHGQWEITYYKKSGKYRGHDWEATHDEYDGENDLWFCAENLKAVIDAIKKMQI